MLVEPRDVENVEHMAALMKKAHELDCSVIICDNEVARVVEIYPVEHVYRVIPVHVLEDYNGLWTLEWPRHVNVLLDTDNNGWYGDMFSRAIQKRCSNVTFRYFT